MYYVLAISIICNLGFGLFLYKWHKHYRKAQFFDALQNLLFNIDDWEAAIDIAERHWDRILVSGFGDIVKASISKKVASNLQTLANDPVVTPHGFLDTLNRIADVASGKSPFAQTVRVATKELLEDFQCGARAAFRDKISTSLWTAPLGQRVLFVAEFLPEPSQPPFLITKILGIYYFEHSILELLNSFVYGSKKPSELMQDFSPAEIAAIKKISAFYRQYGSKDAETETLTTTLENLFAPNEVVTTS